jgi:hypothetical protein
VCNFVATRLCAISQKIIPVSLVKNVNAASANMSLDGQEEEELEDIQTVGTARGNFLCVFV